MATNLNPAPSAPRTDTDAVIDTALATARVFDMDTVPDMNEVEMATAIGQLTATLNMLIAAIGRRPASAASTPTVLAP